MGTPKLKTLPLREELKRELRFLAEQLLLDSVYLIACTIGLIATGAQFFAFTIVPATFRLTKRFLQAPGVPVVLAALTFLAVIFF